MSAGPHAIAVRRPVTIGFVALTAAWSIAAAVVAETAGDHALTVVLCVLQTAMVCWLGALGWTRERGWASVGVITAAAWVPTFLISSWVYAFDPGYLSDIGAPGPAVATVDLSLLCLIAGYLWRTQAGPRPAPTSLVATAPMTLRRGPAAAWAALGCLGFAVIFYVTGGPIKFLNNIAHEGALTTGRTYFVAAALTLTFVALVAAFLRWARGERLSWRLRAAVTVAVLLTATLGARQEIAVPLAELALFYALTRRRIGLGKLLALMAVFAFFVVVVLGMVKRYGNYVDRNPGTHVSRLDYLVTIGPGEFAHSWANNSADGVRLIALGESVVPRLAAPEYGKELLRLLLHPLPHGIRPTVSTAPAIEAAIYPSPVDSYAQPLQLVSYLQFTWLGVVIAFLVAGRAMSALERALTAERLRRPSTLVLLVALAVHVPILMRTASAGADAFSLIEVVGIWLVARTCEAPLRAPLADRAPVELEVGVGEGAPAMANGHLPAGLHQAGA